jgi:membrane-associated phospholipid phosphatase
MLRNLLSLDEAYTRRLRVAEKPGIVRNLSILFAHSGDSWVWLPGLGLLGWFGSAGWRERCVWMLVGIMITALIVFAIKFTVRRRRPEGEWGGIYRLTDPHSFPSGHAARSVMLAVLGIGLGPAWFGIVLLVWAPLVVLARVAMGVHYLSDVLAGALLGLGIGLAILWILYRISPLISPLLF